MININNIYSNIFCEHAEVIFFFNIFYYQNIEPNYANIAIIKQITFYNIMRQIHFLPQFYLY